MTLGLIGVAADQLDTGVIAEDASITDFSLILPRDGDGDRPALLVALRKCQYHATRSLSFPSLLGTAVADLEIDTRESLAGILSSGLPLPKSPSMQLGNAERAQQRDASAEGEREERGWWTLRFQQVLRELQREEIQASTTASGPLSGKA